MNDIVYTMNKHVVIESYRMTITYRRSNAGENQIKSNTMKDIQQISNPTFRALLVRSPTIPPPTFQLAAILAGISAERVPSLSFTLLGSTLATVPRASFGLNSFTVPINHRRKLRIRTHRDRASTHQRLRIESIWHEGRVLRQRIGMLLDRRSTNSNRSLRGRFADI